MSSLLRDLRDVTLADRSLVGGKAASLGELIKTGIAVPSGFVISVEAYGNDMSEQLANEILQRFDGLSVERVAVRSSAVSEDTLSASWAGQLETYLNVKRDGLLKAIVDCWSSVDSDHAKAYADHNSISQSDRAVAVVVQTMVSADIAGVLFTANPVSNDTDQCVIEAVYGLGELLVQGAVTPETYVIDKQTNKVISHTPHRQRKMLVYQDGQNSELPLDDAQAGGNILSQSQLDELMEKARVIEQHYGQPQDIEWAYSASGLFILQSRPITTLSPY